MLSLYNWNVTHKTEGETSDRMNRVRDRIKEWTKGESSVICLQEVDESLADDLGEDFGYEYVSSYYRYDEKNHGLFIAVPRKWIISFRTDVYGAAIPEDSNKEAVLTANLWIDGTVVSIGTTRCTKDVDYCILEASTYSDILTGHFLDCKATMYKSAAATGFIDLLPVLAGGHHAWTTCTFPGKTQCLDHVFVQRSFKNESGSTKAMFTPKTKLFTSLPDDPAQCIMPSDECPSAHMPIKLDVTFA